MLQSKDLKITFFFPRLQPRNANRLKKTKERTVHAVKTFRNRNQHETTGGLAGLELTGERVLGAVAEGFWLAIDDADRVTAGYGDEGGDGDDSEKL